MSNDMNLKVVLDAQTGGFSKGMKSMQQGLSASGGSMAKFSSMAKMGFVAIGVAAAAAGAMILTSFIIKATKQFIEFEETMIKTAAIMGKTGMDELPKLTSEIKQLGAETKTTTQEVAEAAQILALAGLGESEMVDDGALRNLNNLAIAAGITLPEAAAVAISTLKGMQMETSELRKVNDILLNTLSSTFTDITSLGEAMKFLAPTASAAGVSLEEAAAAAGILGNAGLKGSMAGTGLRMMITKLLKPTEAARIQMEKLALDIFTLTPAGAAAKAALGTVRRTLDAAKMSAEATNAQMTALNEVLSDLSIEQQTNSLAIMKIKRRAEKEGRELSKREVEQIDRLENANDDLNITMAERRIEQQIVGAQQKKTNATISEQAKEYSNLNKTVSEQTTGITSLSDVFHQLEAAGATTSQMLAIFGVRGGTAANALLANVDAMDELTGANKSAQEGLGLTAEMVEVMGTSTSYALATLNSEWKAFMLQIGEEFAPMLVSDVIPALRELIASLLPLVPTFAELAVSLGEVLPPIIEALIPILTNLGTILKLLAPFITLIGYAMELWFLFMEPVFGLVGDLSQALIDLMNGDFEGFIGSIASAFGNLILVLNPVYRMLTAIAEMLNDTAIGEAADDAGFNLGAAATGAGVGFAVGGPVGAAIGGAVGGFFFADGGIVDKPTLGIVGEAGPEAVIPLNKLDGIIANSSKHDKSSSSPSSSLTINGGIHIGAGNNLNKRDVKSAIEQVLPSMLSAGTRSGARGVI